MNTPRANRLNIAKGTATPTTGMRKISDDIRRNKYVVGGDKMPPRGLAKKTIHHIG